MSTEVKNRENTARRGFLSGVFLLSVSTLAVKAIGLFFKIPMLSLLGAEGMGYFNSAYEIYALLCVVSTAGLPVALSMLVSSARASGDELRIKKVYNSAFSLFFAFGFTGAAAMLCFAPPLARLIGNTDAACCIAAIAPSLLFVCLSSAVRGYCQGFENMLPTAISQLTEALGKLFLGLLFAFLARRAGLSLPRQAAAAVFGITVGSLASLVYLLFAKQRIRLSAKRGNSRKNSGALKELVLIALPITLSSAVLGTTRIIDMTMIMHRLGGGAEANRIYGAYTTMAIPVFSLMPALITPISMALVPRLSALIEEKNREEQEAVASRALGLTVMLALPASFGLSAFAELILDLLFSGRTEDIKTAAPLLSVLGSAVLFSCLITTANGILQAYRRTYLPVFSMLVGVAVKLVASYFLMGNECVGIMGAPIGSVLCNLTVVLLDLVLIRECCGVKINPLKLFFAPLGAALLSVGGAYVLLWLLNGKADERLLLLACMAFAVIAYFALLKLFGGLDREYISAIPFGKQLLNIFSKKEKEV